MIYFQWLLQFIAKKLLSAGAEREFCIQGFQEPGGVQITQDSTKKSAVGVAAMNVDTMNV